MAIGMPGWPELACWTASMARVRIVLIGAGDVVGHGGADRACGVAGDVVGHSAVVSPRPMTTPLLRRDPQGHPQQVRVGRGAAGDQARPLPLLIGRLSDRLRLHPRHARRGRRPARRDGLRQRADVPRLRDPGEGRSRCSGCATTRASTTRSSACPLHGPQLEPHRDARRPAAAAARRDLALLLDLQAARGQPRHGRRLVLARGRRCRRSTRRASATQDDAAAPTRMTDAYPHARRALRGPAGLPVGAASTATGTGCASRTIDDRPGRRAARRASSTASRRGRSCGARSWRRSLEAGHRCIAPDQPGFGRSDKPTDLGWYSYDRHDAAACRLVEELDLRGATFVVHDWGGPIGLRLRRAPRPLRPPRDPRHRPLHRPPADDRRLDRVPRLRRAHRGPAGRASSIKGACATDHGDEVWRRLRRALPERRVEGRRAGVPADAADVPRRAGRRGRPARARALARRPARARAVGGRRPDHPARRPGAASPRRSARPSRRSSRTPRTSSRRTRARRSAADRRLARQGMAPAQPAELSSSAFCSSPGSSPGSECEARSS